MEEKSEFILTELEGKDIWEIPGNWICITTNGMLNVKKEAIMGKGLALEAKIKVKGCQKVLGEKIKKEGNHVHFFGDFKTKEGGNKKLVSFPTKNNWREKSDLKLINQSCQELLKLWKLDPTKPVVVLSKVGCLNGGLDYQKEVRPLLLKYFGTAETRKSFLICI